MTNSIFKKLRGFGYCKYYTNTFLAIFFLSLTSCATYYQKNIKFNAAYSSGDFKKANQILDSRKKAATRKDRLIYFMNKGMVASMQGLYTESNNSFEEAYKLADSYHTNYVNEGAALLLNSDMVEYRGEDYEVLYINYYKALNYIKMGQKSEALVECRRLNNRLNVINDKYSRKNTFKRNAFVHLLMGLIYESNEEYNNAFIAYRNALEIYEEDYAKFFNVVAPEQLKIDLIRTAYLTGLGDQVSFYENKFNIKLNKNAINKGAELVLLWENGFCPVKEEWSINFTLIPGGDGILTFANSDLGISIPFPMSQEDYQKQGLSDLTFIRVAFPKLTERPVMYNQAEVSINGQTYPLQEAENLNAIAFKTLQDRMLLEMGKSLLRLTLKKSAEYALRKQNQNAGMLLGVFNALTEKADTRQWSVLPHSIYYARMPIQEGLQKINLNCKIQRNQNNRTFAIEVVGKSNSTTFHTFSTLE